MISEIIPENKKKYTRSVTFFPILEKKKKNSMLFPINVSDSVVNVVWKIRRQIVSNLQVAEN